MVIIHHRIHSLRSLKCKTVHMLELNCMRTAMATGLHKTHLVLNSTQQRDKGLSEFWILQLKMVHNSWVFLYSFYKAHVWAKKNVSFPLSVRERTYGFCIKAKQKALISLGINNHTK